MRHCGIYGFLLAAVLAILIATAEAAPQPEPIPKDSFLLTVSRDLAKLDNTVVIRMTVRIADRDRELGTHMRFRYLHEASGDLWSCGWSEESEQHLLFVGQFHTRSPDASVPVLSYAIEHGGSVYSDIQRAEGKKNLAEVLRLTAVSGLHKLEEPVVLGELAGSPILLSVEPPQLKPSSKADAGDGK